MATKGQQGLQIATIIFFMLTVVLGVTTFLGFSNARDEANKFKAEKDDKQKKEESLRAALTDSNELKTMVGSYKEEEKIDKIKTDFGADMKMGGEPAPADYRGLVDALAKSLARKDETLDTLTTQLAKEKADRAADQATHEDVVAKHEAAVTKAVADLGAASKNFTTDRGKVTTQVKTLQAQITKNNAETAAAKAKATKEVADLTQQMRQLKIVNENLTKQIEELRGGTRGFQDYDGKITLVSQQSNTVFLDVGLDDGLRSQVTFSVYAPEDLTSTDAKPKGSIEVIGLPEAKSAEARIVKSDTKNPILPGDVIYSPVWNRGQQLHFALAGFIDIDGDNKSDRAKVKSLIQSNGGVIDAEIEDSGKKVGTMSANTRYLLLGERPTDKDPDNAKAFSGMITEADKLGVDQISLPAFLGQMGYRPGRMEMDREETSRDQGTTPASRGFRTRRPPGRGAAGSAF